jgi:hypothetical protein
VRFIAAANFLAAVHGDDFTLQDLYDEASLTKSDFRRVFKNKSELLAAAGREHSAAVEIEPPVKIETLRETIPAVAIEQAAEDQTRRKDSSDIEMQPEAGREAWPADEEHWIDRRFRILERAISSLETQLSEVTSSLKKTSASTSKAELSLRPETAAYPVEIDLPDLPPILNEPQHQFEPPPLVADSGLGSAAAPGLTPEAKSVADVTSGSARARNREREVLASQWSVANDLPDHKPYRTVIIFALAIMCGILAGILTSTMRAGAGISATKHSAQSAIASRNPSPIQALADQANKGDAAAQTKLAIAYMQGAGVKPDLGTAIHWAQAAASHGNVDAKYLLGALLRAGAKPDMALAARWYQEAAEGGNVKAMHNLGIALLNGSGVPKDETGAVHWFEQAANLGYRDSQFDLAVLYERGEGVAQNPTTALHWYEMAAASGDAEAAKRATWLRQNVRQLASR